MIGTKLDRFELIAELASGGMGTVFLARLGGAGGFQRLYAIKRLHEHLAKHGEFIEMFLDEARLAARIHHPNVVPILEIGTTEAGYYLVMEYVEGDTAGHLFHAASQERKTISQRVTVRIILDVLAGLHAAHEGTDDEGRLLEVVHRDVSPHNILVSVDGVSRITDFGIARAASRLAVTRTGQLKGKIAYMAPEQARSEKIDRRADVFAVGICLWEMLTGRRLFKAEGEGETLNRLLYEPIPSLRSIDPEISAELDAACAKALTRDLSQRYATAAAFSDALESALRSIDGPATHREVAACIGDVLGPDLSERRADLRAWLADTERRSLVPPAVSSGDLGYEAPGGAHVSVYVPSLFESGSLRAHADSDRPSRDRPKRGAKLAVAAVLVVAVASSVTKWWSLRHDAASAAPATVAAHAEHATAAPAPGPTDSRVAAAGAEGPGDAPPSSTAVAVPPRDSATAPAAPTSTAKPLASARSTALAAAKPVHPAGAASHATEPESTARPSPSVPREMLYNPYR